MSKESVGLPIEIYRQYKYHPARNWVRVGNLVDFILDNTPANQYKEQEAGTNMISIETVFSGEFLALTRGMKVDVIHRLIRMLDEIDNTIRAYPDYM